MYINAHKFLMTNIYIYIYNCINSSNLPIEDPFKKKI